MLPATITWAAILLIQIYVWCSIRGYVKRVTNLHKVEKAYSVERSKENYTHLAWPINLGFSLTTPIHLRGGHICKKTPIESAAYPKDLFQKPLVGDNTKHCTLYKTE